MSFLYRILGYCNRKLYTIENKRARVLDKISTAFISTGPFSVLYLLKHEEGDKKYVLLGDDSVTNQIKEYIVDERKKRKSVLANIWCKLEKVDIEIIQEGSQYDHLATDGNQFELMLCVATDRSHENKKYCLPKAGQIEKLKPNIKKTRIFMLNENKDEKKTETAKKTKAWLKQNTEIMDVFKKAKIKFVSLKEEHQVSMVLTNKTDKIAEWIFFAAILLKVVRT